MKITINNAELCRGSSHHESPANLKIKSSKSIQISPLLRSQNASIHDRGNQKTIVTFKNTRIHPSQAHANTFSINHTASLTNQKGDLIFHLEDPSNSKFILTNAIISNVDSSPSGVSSTHSYQIIGSQFKPISPNEQQ